MVLNQQSKQIELICDDARYIFLESGDIREFTNKHFMINQFMGNPLEGSANNIYLKILNEDESPQVYPLLGCASGSSLRAGSRSLIYEGIAGGINYRVAFCIAPGNIWFWKVQLEGCGERVQLVYGQDVGVADKGAVRTNELYMSQYLDHFIDEGDWGYTVCSRQNQSQGGLFPYLQQGCVDRKIIGYCTDAMQFYGRNYRKTNRIEALYNAPIKERYQYELAYVGLWTESFILDGMQQTVFYGLFRENLSTPVRKALDIDKIQSACENWGMADEEYRTIAPIRKKPCFAEPYCSPELSAGELDTLFGERILEEYEENELLSFFKPDDTHVVLQKKELLVERPHGNIITNLPDDKKIRRDLMTSTNFMYGLFHAQTAIGNTDSNRLLCANRGLLNILKNTGQRLYVKIDGRFRILTLPAAYEAALNYSRWYYKLDDDMLIITAMALTDSPVMCLDGISCRGRRYDFIVTNQLSMGAAEFNGDIPVEINGSVLDIFPGESSGIKKYYPKLSYRMIFPGGTKLSDDRLFYTDDRPRNETFLCAAFSGSRFRVAMSGTLDGRWPTAFNQTDTDGLLSERDAATELSACRTFYKAFGRRLHLSLPGENTAGVAKLRAIEKLNVLTTWYIHNAFVHFYTPRGLEQCGGAAWGTRDVCQGPMELLLATGHFELARETLLEVFAHQSSITGEWPQWFMFDDYPYMADECHGDVVFWPLKCLGDYIKTTKDYGILEEQVPFRNISKEPTQKKSVLEHILAAIKSIRLRFVKETALISYAGGDWDDTLQPADPAMKEHLVSAWTQALAYQAIYGLGQLLKEGFMNKNAGKDGADSEAVNTLAVQLNALADQIKEAFNKYLIRDDIIAGFGYIEPDGHMSYMLHPGDEKTGIHYRLLPLTRSIISHLVHKTQAAANISVIDEHLSFPDGVRLMDRPARYDGGVSRYFQRAEQAANVGREISLQYVHAHIRYIEAMAVYGDGDRVFDSLMRIVPINIREAVPNARLRQSNAYFSSSEGDFKDRYEYARKFDLLKTGEMPVKGGWRIYSSGPGIFLGRLITDMLGIRESADMLELDPVLPKRLDGLTLDLVCYGRAVRIIYHVGDVTAGVKKVMCGGQQIPFSRGANPYRPGGAVIGREQWMEAVKNCNEIHLYL